MSEDFDKLPDVVTEDWLDKFYHDFYRGHLNKLNSFQAMDCLAAMINEARAADRQEITELQKSVRDLVEKLNETKAGWNRDHAKIATYEEREKRSAVEFEEWINGPDCVGYSAWDAARAGWEPKRDPYKTLTVEWPQDPGVRSAVIWWCYSDDGIGPVFVSDPIIRTIPQLTPAQIRAEMLAKLDAEYQRIEAEMSRIEAMTDAEVLAQKDYHAD